MQIAVKLPDELVGEFDKLVEGGTYDNRSQAVRAGLEAMVIAQRRSELEQCYRDVAVRFPETREDLADATRLGVDAIHDEPWERWW